MVFLISLLLFLSMSVGADSVNFSTFSLFLNFEISLRNICIKLHNGLFIVLYSEAISKLVGCIESIQYWGPVLNNMSPIPSKEHSFHVKHLSGALMHHVLH